MNRRESLMLCVITILGGSWSMMVQHTRSESLFYYFRIEDQVPEDHRLRLIDGHVSFDFVHDKLRESYSDTGDPPWILKCFPPNGPHSLLCTRMRCPAVGGSSS